MEGRGPDKSFWSRRTDKRSAFPKIKRKLCSFVPVPVFLVPGLAEATLNRGALERGRGTRLTSCCSSQTFQFFDNWMLPTSREPDLMLEVGEKSSIWDTDLLRPLKSGALLGKYFSFNMGLSSCDSYSTYIYGWKRNCSAWKQVSATANLPNMRAEHITASPDLRFVSADKSNRGSPEVVLSVEVVEKAGGGHSGGECLVPHPRCTCSDRVALAMQGGGGGPQLIDQTSTAQAPTVF